MVQCLTHFRMSFKNDSMKKSLNISEIPFTSLILNVFPRNTFFSIVLLTMINNYFFRFLNRRKDEILSSRVIHSLPLRMSVIHVIQNNKIVALSHLIGLDQLPKSDKAPEKRGLILVRFLWRNTLALDLGQIRLIPTVFVQAYM